MQSCFLFVALLPFASAGISLVDDRTVTKTVTRTFTVCPWTTVSSCYNTEQKAWETLSQTTSANTEYTDSDSYSTGTVTTSNTASAVSTTVLTSISTDTIPTTTPSTTPNTTPSTTSSTSTVPGTVASPGASFVPSGQLADRKLAKRSTVYIDLTNPNAAILTTDITKATSFSLDAQGVLSTTLNSYYSICGGSYMFNTPGRFTCSNSGAIPQTFRGWTNDPTLAYPGWTFCYKADLSLYMSANGPTADCTAITFTTTFGVTSGSA